MNAPFQHENLNSSATAGKRSLYELFPNVQYAAQRNDHSRPHVLLIVDQFPKALGGGERVLLRIAELLPRYGFRVSILTLFVHPESAVMSMPVSCPIYVLPLRRTYDLDALHAAFVLRNFLREQHVKIVQTFFESSDLWAGLVVKALSRAKLIWSRRDMGILRDPKHKIAYKVLSQLPDEVFAVSEQVRQHCIEEDGIEPDRVHTIYNGMELLPSKIRKQDSTELEITTIGNVRRVKGHDVLVRAAALVLQQFPNARFSVAGDVLEKDYFQELNDLTTQLGISKRFRFIGGVTDVAAHLNQADIFVLPSRSEGFSNAIIEAMMASLPVVATTVGGNAEAVEDGISGFLIPPNDHKALAAAIMRLCAAHSTIAAMGAEGKEIAAKHFTQDAMMWRITRVYRKLLRTDL